MLRLDVAAVRSMEYVLLNGQQDLGKWDSAFPMHVLWKA